MVMAIIYTFKGDYDNAIDELEYLLSIPSWSTPNYLLSDPYFTPLHDLPRFKQIIRDYNTRKSIN